MKRTATCVLAVLALTASMGSDWIRPKTRVPCLPGIPEREYQHLAPAPQVSVLAQGTSFNGVEVADLASKEKLKLRTFALSQKDLKIQHCSISQVAFTVGDDGRWFLNCRADQNPWFTTQPGGLPPKNIASTLKIETNHLLRNEFFVRVRCYGNFPLKEADKSTGKPALAVIGPIPFWVQRGEPRFINLADAAPQMKQFYPLIDRVEFDFWYR